SDVEAAAAGAARTAAAAGPGAAGVQGRAQPTPIKAGNLAFIWEIMASVAEESGKEDVSRALRTVKMAFLTADRRRDSRQTVIGDFFARGGGGGGTARTSVTCVSVLL
ncbi:unnamed protein product, partial [Phaeothamnion confervicola]